MRRKFSRILFVALAVALLCGLNQARAAGRVLFVDTFSKDTLDPAWAIAEGKEGGEWVVKHGVLSQTGLTPPPKPFEHKLVLVDKEYPEELTIQVKVRVDEGEPGDHMLGGIAVRVDVDTGQGWCFLFHGDFNTMQYLDDRIAWGNKLDFEWKLEEWYWTQLHISRKDELFARIWEVGEKEPKDQLEHIGWSGREGPPGLDGGGRHEKGFATLSFDDVVVVEGGPPVDAQRILAVDQNDKLAATWGAVKSARIR